jgi:hypothetical protein
VRENWDAQAVAVFISRYFRRVRRSLRNLPPSPVHSRREIQFLPLQKLVGWRLHRRVLLLALFEPQAVDGYDEAPTSADTFAERTVDFARCFLRLANLPNYALDRLSRYEAILWRQVAQTLIALDALDRHKPQHRRRPRLQSLQELPSEHR